MSVMYATLQKKMKQTCNVQGALFAGPINGIQCSCGDDDYTAAGESEGGCILPCGGNADEMCGGETATSVYATGKAFVKSLPL